MLKNIYRFQSFPDQGTIHLKEGASFLIVHSMPSVEESIRAFGEKLCKAINLNKQELELLSIKDSDFFDFNVLESRISEGHIVCMAEHAEQYFPNIRIRNYEWLEIGSIRIIFTHKASAIMEDKRMIAHLWEALKKEFL